MKTARLKKDAERRVFAGHLWIFSNDINTLHSPLKEYAAGDLVLIETNFGKAIGIGYINPHCLLCIRVLTLNPSATINTDFFIEKIKQAQSKRATLFQDHYARMVFGESDRLPGIVIDQFHDIIVMQINTAGMEALKSLLIDAVQSVFSPKTIVLKCDSTERQNEGLQAYTEVFGEPAPDYLTVVENNCTFRAPLLTGQKTGWFYDHRFNRARIAAYCRDKKVLDVFSYCGAFSIPAAKNGAKSVTAIDRSPLAIEALTQNAALNEVSSITALCGDALDILQSLSQSSERFDVIILDPPALIKRKKDVPAGEKMYQKLNEAALKLLSPAGILFSASCSMHLSQVDLLNCIRKAGLTAKKEISVLEQSHQGADHPIHPAMPETNYLKGYIVG